jgi:hypothetical protein
MKDRKTRKGNFMKSVIASLLFLSLICGTAFASSAPWYKWMNKFDHTILCNQLSPGEAWVQYQGPFMESQCRKPGNPQ